MMIIREGRPEVNFWAKRVFASDPWERSNLPGRKGGNRQRQIAEAASNFILVISTPRLPALYT